MSFSYSLVLFSLEAYAVSFIIHIIFIILYMCNYYCFFYSIVYHVCNKGLVDLRIQINHTFQKQSQYLDFDI
jgi:hypothetical protein